VLLLEGASMLDVLAAREDMEVAALMRAVPRIGPRRLAVMQDSVDCLREHIADRDRFLLEAGRFHAVINEAARPGAAHPQRSASRHADVVDTSDFAMTYRKRVADEHQDITTRSIEGKRERAIERMRTHVHTSAHSWAERRTAAAPGHAA
jgi:DNA-binding GntR family transcriptional regulator